MEPEWKYKIVGESPRCVVHDAMNVRDIFGERDGQAVYLYASEASQLRDALTRGDVAPSLVDHYGGREWVVPLADLGR